MAVKPKKKCCRSKPRCRRCPVRLQREARERDRRTGFQGLDLVVVPAASGPDEVELARRRVKQAKKELKAARKALESAKRRKDERRGATRAAA